jgi:Holliday junction resolvase RusA-like endonuclease
MIWQAILPFEPRRKRAHTVARTPHGAPVVADPDKAIKKDLAEYIAEHCQLPAEPFTGALELRLLAFVSLPKSISNKEADRRLREGFAHQDTKDCDNINKLYQDVLQTGPLAGKIWNDDRQVCRLIVEKLWTTQGGKVSITVRRIDPIEL